MNKVYIVEMYEYNRYQRYGIFSKLKDARLKLKELFENEKSYWNDPTDNDHKLIFENDNRFVLKYKSMVNEEYFIKKEIVQ